LILGLCAFVAVFTATKVWQGRVLNETTSAESRHETQSAGGPPVATMPGMVWIEGGEFTMGTDSELGWPDEKPAHRVRVEGFWIDETEVTNAQFAAFADATGYVTTAEKPPSVEEILAQSPPGTPPVGNGSKWRRGAVEFGGAGLGTPSLQGNSRG
jgi:formylglycine-generating enzyme